MENLPKVVVLSLMELCISEKLANWNISSSGGMTTVTIRFVGASHIGNTPVHGLRKKSPAQARRDFSRNKEWQSTPIKCTSDMTVQTDVCDFENKQVCGLLVDSNEQGEMDTSHESSIGISAEIAQLFDTTKTKQTAAGNASGNEHEQEPGCVDNETKQLASGNTFDLSTTQEDTHTRDPAMYFQKVVADFRSVLQEPTMRGLTHSGVIVNLEYEKKDENNFWIQDGSESENDYHEDYRVLCNFGDQRYSPWWTKQVQSLIDTYEKHLKEYG